MNTSVINNSKLGTQNFMQVEYFPTIIRDLTILNSNLRFCFIKQELHTYIQLFRERLSNKTVRDNAERYYG